MKLNKFWKAIALIIAAVSVYSLIPVAVLYLKKDPANYTNAQARAKLKDNKGEMFGFIVFGDNHAGLILDDSAALKLIKRMNREQRFKKMPIDFVMSTGDVTFRGSAWDYRVWNRLRSYARYPVLCGMGNHDNDNDKRGTSYFRRNNGEKEYDFADRNSYFIVLDNVSNDFGEKQFAALEESLKASAEYKHRFIFMHKAPISPYQQSWYRPELSPWAYRFMKLCEKYKVDIVFSGHEHISKQMQFGGVRYVVSGGGGIITQVPRQDGGFLHYVVVRVCGDYVDYEVRKVFPPAWEFFAYYMWKDIFYFLKDALF
jgi:predicted phosphodiesterase